MTTDTAAIDSSGNLARPSGEALRVLVVDDSEAIRMFMRSKLKALAGGNYDLQVETAPSGEAAITCCATNPYDLVFMDVVMPGMGGLEACRQIKAAHTLRVAMVSSLRAPEDHAAAHQAGCDNYLAKPVKDADLSAVLRLTSLSKLTARR
jgi:CheY-like chemotaxis protein